MKKNVFYLALIIFALSSCSSGMSDDVVLLPISKEKSPSEIEEEDLMQSMPYIDIEYIKYINVLSENYSYQVKSNDDLITTLSTPAKNVEVNVVRDNDFISTVIINVDCESINNEGNDELDEIMRTVFSALGYSYSPEVVNYFISISEEEIEKTIKTGFSDPIIGLENENEQWSLVYYYLPNEGRIEIRPYKFY